jgi:hypothetical protein
MKRTRPERFLKNLTIKNNKAGEKIRLLTNFKIKFYLKEIS